MHYSNLVLIESIDDIKAAVEEAMARGKDDWWDWYQIGGRWTGLFDGYDPESDPENIQTCELCRGTGTRPDMDCSVSGGCNGCQGKGKRAKWPTQWKQHSGDVIPIERLTKEQLGKFYAVLAGGNYFPGERYVPWAQDKFPKQELPPLEYLQSNYAGYFAVIVDSHN